VKTFSPTPDAILQTASGFWNSKVLLTTVTFDLFTALGQSRLTDAEIGKNVTCILAESQIFWMRSWQSSPATFRRLAQRKSIPSSFYARNSCRAINSV
jgi:hypothetical protein